MQHAYKLIFILILLYRVSELRFLYLDILRYYVYEKIDFN